MATQIPTSYKYCANCIYWEGSRDINPNLHQTTIYDSNGKCSNPKDYRSSTSGTMPQCPNFKAHPNERGCPKTSGSKQ